MSEKQQIKRRCVNCVFWVSEPSWYKRNDTAISAEGQCRAHPPSLVPSLHDNGMIELRGIWPLTYEDDFCGGHKVRKGDSP